MKLRVSGIEVLDNGRPIPFNGIGRFFFAKSGASGSGLRKLTCRFEEVPSEQFRNPGRVNK
jgi:hypothetical protein